MFNLNFIPSVWAVFLLRVYLGAVFTLHGSQKVLGAFGGTGMTNFVAWLQGLGVSPLWAYAAAYAEFAGGVMLLTGFFSQLGAAMTIPVMIGAIALVHWKNGFFIQNQGYEYCLLLIIVAVAVIILGPGKWYLYNPK